jgi:hypothetical protein
MAQYQMHSIVNLEGKEGKTLTGVTNMNTRFNADTALDMAAEEGNLNQGILDLWPNVAYIYQTGTGEVIWAAPVVPQKSNN